MLKCSLSEFIKRLDTIKSLLQTAQAYYESGETQKAQEQINALEQFNIKITLAEHNDPPVFLTLKAFAKRTGIKERTVRHLVQKGELPIKPRKSLKQMILIDMQRLKSQTNQY